MKSVSVQYSVQCTVYSVQYSVHNPPEGGALVAGVPRVGGGPGGAAERGGGGGELLPVTEHHVHLEGDNCKQGT